VDQDRSDRCHHLAGIYLVFGPRRTPTSSDFTWQGLKANLSQNINLGLDLRGGSYLVMRVKTDDYLQTLTENTAQAALTAAQDAKLPVTGDNVVASNGNYSFSLQLSDASQAQAVVDEVKKKVDLVNWTASTANDSVSWSLASNIQTALKDQAVEQALKIIESRINAFGVKEPTLQRHGAQSAGQILLQMPGVDDPERIKSLIGAESRLELMKIISRRILRLSRHTRPKRLRSNPSAAMLPQPSCLPVRRARHDSFEERC
jgi:preprotein translocase subunit SecD